MKEFFTRLLNSAKYWGTRLDYASPEKSERNSVNVYRRSEGQRLLVGQLSSEKGEFVFQYDPSYEGAVISAFPERSKIYRSRRLWVFFAVRIPPFEREDMKNAMRKRSLRKDQILEILGTLAKTSATNSYELELVEHPAT